MARPPTGPRRRPRRPPRTRRPPRVRREVRVPHHRGRVRRTPPRHRRRHRPTTPASPTRRSTASDGVFWPCPSEEHPGTPRMFAERFHHADGRAKFFAVEHRPAGEEPDAEFPLFFTTGRYKEHYNSGAQTRQVGKLTAAQPVPRLEMHPRLARRHRVVTGSRGDGREPPREGRVRGRGDRRHPPGHAVRAVPLGRARRREPADQRRPRPDQPDAGVQAGGRADRLRARPGRHDEEAAGDHRQRHGRRPAAGRAAAPQRRRRVRHHRVRRGAARQLQPHPARPRAVRRRPGGDHPQAARLVRRARGHVPVRRAGHPRRSGRRGSSPPATATPTPTTCACSPPAARRWCRRSRG